MYRSHFSRELWPRELFAELDRVQHELQQAFDLSPSIRGGARGAYPALNVGTTAQSIEIYCFAPGVMPESIDVQIEKGVLSISGERHLPPELAAREDRQRTLHIDERFVGKFRRVLALPDDADPEAVSASYRDGVLQISIQRRKAAEPRRIVVQ